MAISLFAQKLGIVYVAVRYKIKQGKIITEYIINKQNLSLKSEVINFKNPIHFINCVFRLIVTECLKFHCCKRQITRLQKCAVLRA